VAILSTEHQQNIIQYEEQLHIAITTHLHKGTLEFHIVIIKIQLLVYADDVNILGGSVHTVQENAEALVVASEENGLGGNADKTKYMVMCRDQNAGRNQIMETDNSTFERVEQFKYLGTTFTYHNSIQEEIKSRSKLGNACCHSVQNLFSFSLISKNIKIKIYRTIILPVVLYGCETW